MYIWKDYVSVVVIMQVDIFQLIIQKTKLGNAAVSKTHKCLA